MEPDGCDKGADPAGRLVGLVLEAFSSEVLVVGDERLGDVAVPQVDNWWPAEERCERSD
jgi:hypothetical protein